MEDRQDEAQRHYQMFLSICKLISEFQQSVTLHDLMTFSAQVIEMPIVDLIIEGRKLYLTFKKMVQTENWLVLKIAQERFYEKKHILPNDCFSDLIAFYNDVNVAAQTLEYTDDFPCMWMIFKNTLCETALSQINIIEVAAYLDNVQRREKQLAYGSVVECIGQNMGKIEDPVFWDYLSAICLTNKQLCEERRAICPLKENAGMQTP